MRPALKSLLLAAALAASAAAEILDHQKIHALYADGEFEKVIKEIEGFEARNKTYTHNDSAFVARYLAVVYSANPATREKGKFYMYQLLKLQPEAQLMGMYANEEIEKLFERMKTEYYAKYDPKKPPEAQRPGSVTVPAPAAAPGPADNPAAVDKREQREAERQRRLAEKEERRKRAEMERAARPESRFRAGVFGALAIPMGPFASKDGRFSGAALTGLGLGGEFLFRIIPKLYASALLGIYLNPYDTEALEDALADANPGSTFTATGGSYFNVPLLIGPRFHHQFGRGFGVFVTTQGGISSASILELEVKEDNGAEYLTAFEDDAAWAGSLGAGATIGRRFAVSLRVFSLGRPVFKSTISGTDSSGQPLVEQDGQVSVAEYMLTLAGAFMF